MKAAPIPANDHDRLKALHRYRLLDTLPEAEYDAITRIASEICRTPISVISLVDQDRVWFKSRQRLKATEAPRDLAFCSYAINDPDQITVVQDTRQDERFQDNPLVTGELNLQFYAGIPLVNEENYPLGTLCVMDQRPRQLTGNQLLALQALGKWVITLFKLRTTQFALNESNRQLEEARNKNASAALPVTPQFPTSNLSPELIQQTRALKEALDSWLNLLR